MREKRQAAAVPMPMPVVPGLVCTADLFRVKYIFNFKFIEKTFKT
jgi:hypothetical protein